MPQRDLSTGLLDCRLGEGGWGISRYWRWGADRIEARFPWLPTHFLRSWQRGTGVALDTQENVAEPADFAQILRLPRVDGARRQAYVPSTSRQVVGLFRSTAPSLEHKRPRHWRSSYGEHE